MDKKTLEKNYQKLENCILNNELKDALDLVRDIVINTRKGELISQYESLDETYESMLRYTIEGAKDPERHKIYQHLKISVLELADVAYQQVYLNQSDQHFYRLKKAIENRSREIKEETIDNIDDLVLSEELSDIIYGGAETGHSEKEEYFKHQEILIKIFNLLWLTDKFKDADQNMVKAIWKNKNFPWYERAIIISAITISVIRCFDTKKIHLLIEYSLDDDIRIRQRSLVGLVMVLHSYNRRMNLYPDVINDLERLKLFPDIEFQLELIIIQFLKSKETEKITKKLEEEIIPEMVKFQPVLKDKLDLDNILSDEFLEDKNPDWERVFEDAPDLLDKLQEISNLQMEGADVFMSAFARLKHFDFFNEMINWFRPFYKENFLVRQSLSREKGNFNMDVFLDGLANSFFMCNSDKYSFCLNIEYMPEMQKNMMMDMFNAELETLKELQEEDDILNKSATSKSIYSQYIQDLYRFYKLFPLRREFQDFFKLKFDFYDDEFFKLLIENKEILRNIAEFLFEKGYYEKALEAYLMLNGKGINSMEIFEKIGYCYQMLKDYESALSYYKRAELFDANRAWNLKKIALCHRHLKNYEESLKLYQEAEKLEPENLYIQTYIGHCYLDLKEYEKALEYYFKVELMAEGNKKVLRPIAWCSFVLGKFETSKKYFERLMQHEANKYDYMNLGHVEWCLGNRKAALKNYKLSINREDNNLKAFLAGFEEDKKYLLKFGIDPDEISLMIDFLKYML
jgi:tetratricopeptide (TPR) repeat protein